MINLGVHLISGALSAVLFTGDPFLFLAPQLRLSAVERRDLDAGKVIARTLDSAGSGQIAAVAIGRTAAAPETLIAHARAIENLKRSSYVTGIGRFSDPPRLDDLDGLVLPPAELQAARSCIAADNCSLKLDAAEIQVLRDAGSANRANRDAALQDAFRRVVLGRARDYIAGGSDLLSELPLPRDRVESILYWSIERYGPGKPTVLVTHLVLGHPRTTNDPALVAGRQVFASHYMTGGSSLMAITTDRKTGARYLIYFNRTGVDLLGGFLGPAKRALLESRLERELPEVIRSLRSRLERAAASTTR